MGDFDGAEPRLSRIINPKVSALFVGLLVVFVYLFFALDAAEAKSATVNVSINGLTYSQVTAHRTVGELVDSLYPNNDQVITVWPTRSTEVAPNLNVSIQLKPVEINRVVAKNLEKSRTPKEEPIIVAAAPKVIEVEPKSPTYSGTATWYRFGSGLTTASTQFAKGTRLRVIAVHSGKQVDVTVNDYGPELDTGIILDLNKPAFAKIAPLGAGRVAIRYYVI